MVTIIHCLFFFFAFFVCLIIKNNRCSNDTLTGIKIIGRPTTIHCFIRPDNSAKFHIRRVINIICHVTKKNYRLRMHSVEIDISSTGDTKKNRCYRGNTRGVMIFYLFFFLHNKSSLWPTMRTADRHLFDHNHTRLKSV